MNDSIQLSASFRIEGGGLVLAYEVVNRGRRDAYLLNRLYRTTPQWNLSPDVVYVELDRERQQVRVYKKLADLPKGASPTSPVAPFVTPLRAGGSFHEEVHIPLPVREYTQYGGPAPEEAADNVRTYKSVYFLLGYYWRPDGTAEETGDVQGTQVIRPRTPRGVPLEFGEVRSDPVPLAIPVLER